MSEVREYKTSWWWVVVITVLVVCPVAMFVLLYSLDGVPQIATSPYPAEVVLERMEETEHIRFLGELGSTPGGETLFSYQWVNYGLVSAFGAMDEEKELKEELQIIDVG